jgi:uncharacterized protein with NAD-binding domain and iron-sulfur cluster
MKVIIVGGGYAGLSAAHMLVSTNQEIEVHLYESDNKIGGQAGTMLGEHCYVEYSWRVFFGSYFNLWSIMKDIGVMNNFETTRNVCTYEKDTNENTQLNSPFKLFKHLVIQSPSIFLKICDLMCECKERLITEHDEIEAATYFNNNTFMRTLIGPYLGLEVTKTSLSALLNFLFNMIPTTTWVSNLPTYEAVFKPWLAYLKQKNVHFHLSTPIEEINYSDEKINYLVANQEQVFADNYIIACSLKPLNKLLRPSCQTFKNMRSMENFLQLYFSITVTFNELLKKDECDMFVLNKTPWLLFVDKKSQWNKTKVLKNCSPYVKQVWNIAVIDNAEGSLYSKILSDCTKEEATDEVLFQLKNSPYMKQLLGKTNLSDVIINVDIWKGFYNDSKSGNLRAMNPKFSPNLKSNTLIPRTQPADIPKNMFLAGYYVKSTMGGASMESSTETGLTAAQELLKQNNITSSVNVIPHNKKLLAYTFLLLPIICLDYVLYLLHIPSLNRIIPGIFLIIINFIFIIFVLYYLIKRLIFNK